MEQQLGLLPMAGLAALELEGQGIMGALEGSEARVPHHGQCRWRPAVKTLKERLRYIPDSFHAIDFVSSAPTSVDDMDTTRAGISSLATSIPH
nr:unnamed protein product [Digitaria exilis]